MREERDLANLGDGFVEESRPGASNPAQRTRPRAKNRARK